MILEIISPDKEIYNGDVSLVQLPGVDGSFEILNMHAPLISNLTKGKLKVIDSNKKELFFEIRGGVVEVLKNKILILAE